MDQVGTIYYARSLQTLLCWLCKLWVLGAVNIVVSPADHWWGAGFAGGYYPFLKGAEPAGEDERGPSTGCLCL